MNGHLRAQSFFDIFVKHHAVFLSVRRLVGAGLLRNSLFGLVTQRSFFRAIEKCCVTTQITAAKTISLPVDVPLGQRSENQFPVPLVPPDNGNAGSRDAVKKTSIGPGKVVDNIDVQHKNAEVRVTRDFSF